MKLKVDRYPNVLMFDLAEKMAIYQNIKLNAVPIILVSLEILNKEDVNNYYNNTDFTKYWSDND